MDKIQSQQFKCPSRNHHVIVIVRAAGDEPVLLNVVDKGVGFIELEGSQPGNTIRFPRHRVYNYDQKAFTALQTAYSTGDAANIEANWKQCDLYD